MADDRVIIWNFVRYTLTPFRDGWRIRSRRIGNEIDWQFPACGIGTAKELALARFQSTAPVLVKADATLQDVVDSYLKMPKRSGAKASYNNTTRLAAIVRLALGKELNRVFATEVGPTLWAAFMAAKLPDGKLDLSTRRAGNAAINSAVCSAVAIFTKKLRPKYLEQGIEIPEDASMVEWLPEMKLPKPPADDTAMQKAWKALRSSKVSPATDTETQKNERDHKRAMYDTIGLARFAGLRKTEIAHCQRHWIIVKNGSAYIDVRDRPEEGYLHKTGESYKAIIIHPAFASELLMRPKGLIVRMPPRIRSREEWFERKPQAWVKPFTGKAKKPLHRLRSLYAEDVKTLTENAMAASQAGIKAASEALGHTSTRTTTESYLSKP